MLDPKNYGVHSLEEVLELMDTDNVTDFRKRIAINALKYSLKKVLKNSVGSTLHDRVLFNLLNELIRHFDLKEMKNDK